MTDEELLLQRAQAYDPEALTELYDRYAPLVYAYLYRRVHDAQTAEDLTGDVFLSVLEAIQSDKFWRTSFRAWLYRIAGNRVIDYYREMSKVQSYPMEYNLTAMTTPLDTALAHKQSQLFLRAAFDTLPPSQQEVLTLRFGQRLKTKEVAEILGKTVGAVEALQNRALNALRKFMDTHESHDDTITD
ncbi:MAG: sigma-70 family RNA polymerase sigma factor [Anaerolineales bacterium]|nr:MAG: sigma-70 family RNA polymerase sigma factor [Anaerolineales bacterium]